MPLFIKVDFRENGTLGGWWTRNEVGFCKTTTKISETRIRDVLIAVADEIDPIIDKEGPKETQPTE